jgi:hypothetical protein
MSLIAIRLAASSVLSCVALVAAAAGPLPVPPVKPGLWETRISALDANGRETAPPELAALSRLSPQARDAMKARGVSLPDANGAIKACLTKEMFESGRWQQMASESGCTTNYSTLSSTTWKWHSSCTALKSESDGETVFSGGESYRSKTTTTTMTGQGQTKTSTRIVQGKWLGAECGDIKPLAPPAARK